MNFLTFLLIGCITIILLSNQTISEANTIDQKNTTTISINNVSLDNYALYNEVIDKIMSYNSISNIGMKYIGYDIQCPKIADVDNIDTYIQNALAEYNVGVFKFSNEKKETSQLPNHLTDTKGIIITIDKIVHSDKKIDISFTKSFVNKNTGSNQNYNPSKIITNSLLEYVV